VYLRADEEMETVFLRRRVLLTRTRRKLKAGTVLARKKAIWRKVDSSEIGLY